MGGEETFDVVIVGSGPAGATFARVLKDDLASARVLLVESGPLITHPPGRHVKTLDEPSERERAQIASQGPVQAEQRGLLAVEGARAAADGQEMPTIARPGTWLVGAESGDPPQADMPAAAMSSNVGGMGAHWTCACPTPGIGERVTLISDRELDTAFDRARRLLAVTQTAFSGAPLGDEVRSALGAHFNRGRDPARLVQPMPLALRIAADGARRWSGPDVILGPLATSDVPGFELRSDTVARAIEMDGDRASGVKLYDRISDVEYRVAARAVVAACDAFRTPQLLWASGLRSPAVGHYLNDQPQVTGTVILDDRFIPSDRRVHKTAEGLVDLLSGVSWIPYDDVTFPFHGQIMQMDASPVPMNTAAETWPGSIVECGLFATKDIRFEDRVEFDDDRLDCFGLPAISIRYGLTGNDQASIARMVELVELMTGLLGAPINDYPPFASPAGNSLHFQGTSRMGAVDDGTSVCDSGSKVWGTRNVYVAGNGVIPTPTACNPTLTTVAHAAFAATRLAARLDD